MNWLEDYLQWTRQRESPSIFHTWAAIAGIGHVLGRRVWLVRYGGGDCWAIYPGQIMVVLVAESGVVRKSSAIGPIRRLLNSLPKGTVNILPKKTSPQELLDCLVPRDADGTMLTEIPACGFLVASEMGAFFTAEGFLESMATAVTDLNDAPHGLVDPETHAIEPWFDEVKFRSWSRQLRDPCIGMLAGTTPGGIATELPPGARTRGFFGRVFWVWAERSDRPPNPGTRMIDPLGAQLTEKLIDGLEQIASRSGPIWFSRDAREFYDTWYTALAERVARIDTSIVSECGFLSRLGEHVLRVAIVLAAMRTAYGKGKWHIARGDLEGAIKLLHRVERELPTAMRDVGTSKLAEPTAKMLAHLERRPDGITRAKLMSLMWKAGVRGKETFDAMIDYLRAADEIEAFDGATVATTLYKRRLTTGRLLQHVREPKANGTAHLRVVSREREAN